MRHSETMPRGSTLISGPKLTELRRERHLTQLELAGMMGLTEGRVRQLEGDETAAVLPSKFRKLAESLGESQDWLWQRIGRHSMEQREEDFERGASSLAEIQRAVRDDEARRAQRKKTVAQKAPTSDSNIEPYSEVKVPEIPLFELAVAAGGWAEVEGIGEVCDPTKIDHGLFRVRIRGDSMEPEYHDGQVVEFKCLRFDVEGFLVGKDYYIQRSDDGATFKRLESVSEDEIMLRAINKKKYPKPMPVPRQMVSRAARAVFKGAVIP